MSTTSPSTSLRELSAAALIGTDRSGGGAAAPSTLLSRAALHAMQARAGLKPRTVATHLPECTDDPRPPASAACMATLQRLLADPDASLIQEWCVLAHAAGQRVADAVVPHVLDWWSRQQPRDELVFRVLGTRGEWLAALNPAWRKPVATDDIPANADERWQTGTIGERVALLLTIRRHDAQRGLGLVQSTWSTDGAEDRRRFVTALRPQRSMSDEPFLEQAIDDKSKGVRRDAAQLLAEIPGSRLRARMDDRARAIIAIESKRGILKRKTTVTLTPPKEFDPAWERDGLEEQAAGGTGKRAWWMRQILAACDLSVWSEPDASPRDVLNALATDDFCDDALHAIRHAATTANDHVWCSALLHALLARDKVETYRFPQLWDGLPAVHTEPMILTAAEHKRFSFNDRWMLVASWKKPWSAAFSTSALKLLHAARPAKPDDAMYIYSFVADISRAIAPSAADLFETTITSLFADRPTDSFQKSIDRVRLRADMHKEFAS